jgi:hypothetical protein
MAYANKTQATNSNVDDFLRTMSDQVQRSDSRKLMAIMQKVSGEAPILWGTSIVGFGSCHYVYASGREGDTPQIAFSPRKGKLTLYFLDDLSKYTKELDAMGTYKVGKGCLYIKRLDDVNITTLELFIQEMHAHTNILHHD